MTPIQSGSTSRWIFVFGGLALGYVLAQPGNLPQIAQAEVRETVPRAAFQAGSERSEAILKEIATTLKSIDGRLERIEKLSAEKKLP